MTDDVKLVVRDLLRAEFDEANVAGGFTPEFRTGWRDSTLSGPLVTVSNDEESATTATGYSGVDGASRYRGTVQVDAWANRDVVSANPKTAVHGMYAEVKRIVRTFGPEIHTYSAWPGTSRDVDLFEYLSYMGRQYMPEEPDDTERPIRHRYMVMVGFEYLDPAQ